MAKKTKKKVKKKSKDKERKPLTKGEVKKMSGSGWL